MSAQPIRWVNDTLPPRERFRWLLITMRLSIISFAGIVRTLVAVGTVRLAFMFVTSALAMPRIGVTLFSGSVVPSAASAIAGAVVRGASAGIGCGFGSIEVVRATG